MPLTDHLGTLRTLGRAGLLAPGDPRRIAGAARAIRHWGLNYAGGFAAAAARHRDTVAVIDDRGTATWAEIDRWSDALAVALRRRGLHPHETVALLARNHRGFVVATAALAKLGVDTLCLNTGFAPPQLREVLARDHPLAIIYDEEYRDLLSGAADDALHVLSWVANPADRRPAGATPTIDALVAEGEASGQRPEPPDGPGRTIILTSGTTGTPKGAPREQVSAIDPVVAMLDRIPYRSGDVTVLAAPLFHSWGFGNLSMGLMLGSTFVLRHRFDPETTLADIAAHRAGVLVAVPVMLQRILELPPEVRRRHDTSSLRVVPLSGSAIPAGLATRWMDEFGNNLYNLYGSTEVGWATIATPDDLRADPTTAGRPPAKTVVRLLDERGREVRRGESGRIFVGNDLLFDGYTGGGSKEMVDGLMSTGDTGHFDDDGRLYVDGRDDEMIVSGGENVFPREVEDLLDEHPAVREVAVVGVADDDFGQRLKAVVVRHAGAELDAEGVRAHVRDNLARFKVPRDVVFVDELPRNATCKIVKRALT
jgi:fatty-acyl-CoA synthase